MRVAVIGAGLMGAPMALRLLDAGHEVTVYARDRARAESLASRGARTALSGPAALAAADVAILMLRDGPATRAALFAGEAPPDFTGRTVVQMGTIAPAESLELHRRVTAGGGDYLEAPVQGSIPQVESGTLLVLVGATAEQYERWLGLLRVFSPRPRHVGPVGQAALLKLCLNQIMASQIASFALSLGLARRADVAPAEFMAILRETAMYAPVFDRKLDGMVARSFATPHFTSMALLKDVDLSLAEARAAGLRTTALEGVREAFALAVEKGLGGSDYSSVYEVVDARL